MFDAHEILHPKSQMNPLHVMDIKKNNLVLLEAKLIRYRTKDADNKWSGQHSQFELLAVSLLNSTPETLEEDKESYQDIEDIYI